MSTNEQALILIVDDDAIIRQVVSRLLAESYRVEVATDGEAGLARARELRPDGMIVDIQMPKMGGFELCEALHADFELNEIPVMLMSAAENKDELLKAYDVGGDGYITKPIDPKALRAKVAHMLETQRERKALQEQISYATSTAFTAMSSMSETGLVMESIKQFNLCETTRDLGEQIMLALGQFELEGAVALAGNDETVTLNRKGPATDVERSVLQHVASMGRIQQFSRRLALNFPNIKLMVSNMPLDDEDRCGRLRDHLAILTEAAETRLEALKVKASLLSVQRKVAIVNTIQSLTGALLEIDNQQREGKANRTMIFNETMLRLEESLSAFGLSDRQEQNLLNIVREAWERVAATYGDEADLQDKLSRIVRDLQQAASS
ncbi:response regulator [Chitinilyticum piscinae]|uniref:Response regulator n=1 Tax=Chitinilyticum piscinae TaxID=2866724 RepID=A0A8J7FYM3_9NEIS|nr:response regulator [Chitinilyticum piscinae]MBE9608093.1 response regulator [Chitinilyticum piscinae]